MAKELIDEATQAGCRRRVACEALGITLRTLERWEHDGFHDQRKGSRALPANAFTAGERDQIVQILNEPQYQDKSPNQIVVNLADQGKYIGSESTYYRIMRAEKLNKHRQASRPVTNRKPQPLVATQVNQVWSWDITLLAKPVQGMYWYLYLVLDLFSRKIVAWQVHDRECSQLAASLITEGCYVECVSANQLSLHSDNGAPMKGSTMLATLQALGVVASFSRPGVSDDNAYSEALFKTLKYRPGYPSKPFGDITLARQWVEGFVHWYNHEHLHSGIKYVTPAQRHTGHDVAILQNRDKVYKQAQARHPERWTTQTRDWSYIDKVTLNERNGHAN